MKYLVIIIICLTFLTCNTSEKKIAPLIPKQIEIPDSTNNRYAKIFDYPHYLKKIEITKQLHLNNLEGDTINSEIRVWFLGSNYNPQQVYSINNKDSLWTITKLDFYLDFNEQSIPKVDSSSQGQGNKKAISAQDLATLDIEKLWHLQSQSEMKKGSTYGCMDGYALLIEMNSKEKYKYLFYMCPDFHVSKDSTFKNIVDFKDKVVSLFGRPNFGAK